MVGQGPRLVIREMVLENFKSYAGAQRVGPFHKVLCPAVQIWLLLRPRASMCSTCFLTSCMLSNLLSIACAQSFSSVVGPNGSGKSNVIDAMLFVFGKRAKQVRHSLTWSCQRPLTACPLARLWVCLGWRLKASRFAELLPCRLQLRLNKVSELIHNSTHHQNLEMARVSVHFQEILDTVRCPSMICCGFDHMWLHAALQCCIP